MKKNIIILHGWASQLKNWQKFKKFLSQKNYSVYLPKLPGFDQKLQKPLTLTDYQVWLLKYLKQKNIKKANLLGHSFGGQIAISFAARYPQKVNCLILISSSGIRPKISFKKLLVLPIAKLGKLVFSLPFLSSLYPRAQKILYQGIRESDYFKSSPMMKKTMQNILTKDQKTNLLRLKTPTLILWGQNDRVTPLKQGRLTHQLIKDSKLVIFKNSAHGLPFQKPKKVILKISQFIP